MPRASAAHATEMRQRILDGAHRAMLSGGYRGTTMPAIAAESEVSVGLLYRYFESKEELYLAMCEYVSQAQLNELAAQMGQISDPRERLARAVGHFVESLEAERWGAIITTGWAEADVQPALRDLLRRRCDQIRAFAAMFLREAIARGEIEPDVDVGELSLATTMLMDGVIAHQAELGDRFDPGLVQRSVIALVGRSLRPIDGAPVRETLPSVKNCHPSMVSVLGTSGSAMAITNKGKSMPQDRRAPGSTAQDQRGRQMATSSKGPRRI